MLLGGAMFAIFGGPRVLVAEALRAHARRAARQGAVLARLHRLQRDVPAAVPARVDGHAAARLHVRFGRPLGGLQHGLDDRLVRDRRRPAGFRRERDQDAAHREARGARSLAGRHARVVRNLTSARMELRPHPTDPELTAVARPARAAGGAPVNAS